MAKKPIVKADLIKSVHKIEDYVESHYTAKSSQKVALSVIKRWITSGETVQGFLDKSGKAIATKHSWSSILNRFCTEMGINDNATVEAPKRSKYGHKDAFTTEERAKILSYVDTEKDHETMLLKAAVMLGLTLGFRIGDCLNLRKDMVSGNVLTIKRKGGKIMRFSLDPKMLALLEDTMNPRNPDNPYIFGSRRGMKAISQQYLTRLFRAMLDELGITREGLSFHSLRHTAACMLAENGCTDDQIRQFLGQNDTATTHVYLTQFNSQKVIDFGVSRLTKLTEALRGAS